MSLTKKEIQFYKRLNNLREVVDTDPEWATEYIIELEDELKRTVQLFNNAERYVTKLNQQIIKNKIK